MKNTLEKACICALDVVYLYPLNKHNMKQEQTPKTRIWKKDYEWIRSLAHKVRKNRPEIISKLVELGKQQPKEFFK